MKSYEKAINKIMKAEHCDRAKAEKFFVLSKRLTAPDFTSEEGKQIYAELEALRRN